MESIIVGYCKKIFSSSDLFDLDSVLKSVDHCITLEMAASLQEPFIEAEILDSLHQILPTKA